MKIKTKKEMNLPQFIAWAVDNHITGSFYANNRVNAKRIRFEFGRIVSSHGELRSHDTFTVEIEEEITEDTKINKLLVKFKSPSRYQMFSSDCINGFEIEEGNIEAFYVLNDDLTLTLIWTKEKGLIS